jgi:trehalose-6-phosphate synthase
MLLPELLRNRLQEQGKSCAIGFSLHTPFPAGDFWRNLPVRKHLIEGLLSSDLIGFHTDEYKQNFIDTCASLLYVSALILPRNIRTHPDTSPAVHAPSLGTKSSIRIA